MSTEYASPSCPNCGAPLDFPPTAEKATCGYCKRTIYAIRHESGEVSLTNQPKQMIYDSPYPVPSDAQNFSKPLKGDRVNFQTSLSLEQIATFYRQMFAAKKLEEIGSLANIAEDTVSLVFKKANDDRLVVLQAVDMAYDTDMDVRNVNLRTEKNQ